MSLSESTPRTLTDLATEIFASLNGAERRLLEGADWDDAAQFRKTTEQANDALEFFVGPIIREPGPMIPVIRSEILRWMCSSDEAFKRVDRRGIKASAVRFIGRMDLDGLQPAIPLQLERCLISEGISLRFATFAYVNLEGCTVEALEADFLVTRGSVILNKEFYCRSRLLLRGAKIGGNLRLERASIAAMPAATAALDAQFAVVSGEVRLCDGFRADGMVNLFCARIEKNLVCGGTFVAGEFLDDYVALTTRGGPIQAQEVALKLEGAEILGSFYTPTTIDNATDQSRPPESKRQLSVRGQIRLFHTTIRGSLELNATDLECRTGPPLFIESSQIDKSVHLRNGFVAMGGIKIRATSIGGALDLSRSRLCRLNDRPSDDALHAPYLRVGQACLFKDMHAEGSVNLNFAHIGADVATGQGDCYINGDLSLYGATIHGTLNLSGGAITSSNSRNSGAALKVGRAVVAGNVILRGDWNIVDARQTTIGGNFDCLGVSLRHVNGISFDLRWAKVAGAARFDSYKVTKGQDRKFSISGTLRLDNATLGRLADQASCWPKPGDLFLDGLIYSAIAQVTIEERLDWLKRQNSLPKTPLQPYERLALILRQSGREDDAREVAIAKQQAYGAELSWLHRQIRRVVYGSTIAYGYKPHHCWRYAPVLIAIAWIILAAGGGGLMRPTKEAAQKQWAMNKTLPAGYTEFDGHQLEYALYAIEGFIPGLNFKVREYWEADERAPCKEPLPLNLAWAAFAKSANASLRFPTCGMILKVYLAVHALLGAVISTLVAAGLAGITRRSL